MAVWYWASVYTYYIYVYIYIYIHIHTYNVHKFRHALLRNAIKLVLHLHNYCSALVHRTAAVDNNRKRWWLTRWKTKVPVIVSNFFQGFIGDSIVNTLALREAHFISPFLRWFSLPRRWNFTPLPQVIRWAPCFMCMCALYATWGFWVNLDLVIFTFHWKYCVAFHVLQ